MISMQYMHRQNRPLERDAFPSQKFKTRSRPCTKKLGTENTKGAKKRGQKVRICITLWFDCMIKLAYVFWYRLSYAFMEQNENRNVDDSRRFHKWCIRFLKTPQRQEPKTLLHGKTMGRRSIYTTREFSTIPSFQNTQGKKQSFDPFRGS